MHISTRSRRTVGLLTALGAVLVTFASTATAALARQCPAAGREGATGRQACRR